jgi:cytosine/adenosine deaminase-related metal-dependent hydrolase
MGIALNELGLVPFEQTRAEVALAEELGVLLTAHTDAVLGVPYQEVDVLHRAGLLGPRQVHSHCNACTDASLALLREHGASVSSTPSTELQMGMGSPIVLRARDAGLLPSLGSDIQSNNREDMFTEMRLGLQAERARSLQALSESEGLAGLASLDGLPLTTREILHYATLGGAEALGLGDVCGSIEVGKAADLVLIRNDSLHLRPIVDPIATIVLHAGPDDVDTVLVDGAVVKRDGRIVHRDVAAATRAIDAAYGRVADAVAQRGGWKPPIPEGMMDQLGTMLFANLGDAVAIA